MPLGFKEEGFLYYLKSLRFKGKKAAVFGCYGWSGEGNRVLREKLTEAGFEVVNPEVKSSWNPEQDDFAKIPDVVKELIGGEEKDGIQTTWEHRYEGICHSFWNMGLAIKRQKKSMSAK